MAHKGGTEERRGRSEEGEKENKSRESMEGERKKKRACLDCPWHFGALLFEVCVSDACRALWACAVGAGGS